MVDTMNEAELKVMDPKEIGVCVKMLRTMNGWTQETLAELAGLPVRTIQRMEGGAKTSIHTRRAVAGTFKFEDLDIFDKPVAVPSEEQARKQHEEFERDHMNIATQVAMSGKQLADLAEKLTCWNFNLPDGSPPPVSEGVAEIFDCIADYVDGNEHCSMSQKLEVHAQFEEQLAALRDAGWSIFYAVRNTKIVGKGWVDKTPWAITIGYFAVAPKGKEPKLMIVPKAIGLGG